jgi:hypothetical protein
MFNSSHQSTIMLRPSAWRLAFTDCIVKVEPYDEISRSQKNPHADLTVEIDALLNLAQEMEERGAGWCRKSPLPAKFFRGLAALKRALATNRNRDYQFCKTKPRSP